MRNVKQNRGFTAADIVISVVIIGIFVGLIANIFYNFYLSTSAKTRNAIALNCIIDVIEEAKSMKYDEVNQNSMNSLIETLTTQQSIPNGYILTAQVEKYNETEGNTDKEDLIKILKVNVEYTVAQKTEKIEISTLLTK